MTYDVQIPSEPEVLDASEEVVATAPARTVPVLVPAARYTSPEFFERELRDMWPNTWQLACTLDHVSEPGDYYEHRVGKLSILVVRGDDGELRAFQNVCRHRGAELCSGAGGGLQELRCPFHRWTWGLDGRLREVPSRREFGVRNDDYPLFAASVGTWGPLVFVNGDPDAATARPLAEYLDPVPDETGWARIDDWRCTAVVSMRQECNWKTLIEAFSETYHVQGIHREMLGMADDVHGPEVLWERHGRLVQSYGVQSPRVGRTLDDAEVYRAFVEVMGERMGVKDLDAPVPPIPEGCTLRDAIAAQIVEHNRAQGVELGDFTTAQLLDLEQYNLFPNITVLFFGDMLSIVRSRPGAHVEEAFMDGFFFRREQHADAPRTKPYAVDLDTGAEPPFGMVLNQDVRNFLPSQRGLHQPGLEYLTVSPTAECRIVNLHRNLERALGITPTEMPGLAENGLGLRVSGTDDERRRVTVDELIARAEITDVIMDLARGTDRLDEELMAGCYHADGFDDHNAFRGSGTEFARWVCDVLPHFEATMHFVGPPRIRIDADGPDGPDVAHVDTYCEAHHVGRPDADGNQTDMVLGLRYVDRFERRPAGPEGRWLIARRVCAFDWSSTVTTDAAARYRFEPDFTVGRRVGDGGRTDITYLMRSGEDPS